jgi:hypothetical protein
MNMSIIDPPSYSGYRLPAVIISHCTWLYFRFALSYRDVEEMMAERGEHHKLREHPPVLSEVWRDLYQADSILPRTTR